jgi:integrase
VDFLKKHHETRSAVVAPRFTEAVEAYKRDLETDSSMKPQSKQYRLWCLQKIQRTWPKLWDLRLDQITEEDCKEWAAKLNKESACHYYNNTIATLRQVLDAGIAEHKRDAGTGIENPAQHLSRVRIRQKELQLPELAQFFELVKNLKMRSGGWGRRVGDLIEFLAFSGLRIRSEALWVNWEDIDWQCKEIIVRGHPQTGTKNSEIRRIPIILDMENLLKRLQAERPRTGPILIVRRCYEALARACNEIEIPRLTHYDFRHLSTERVRTDKTAEVNSWPLHLRFPRSTSGAWCRQTKPSKWTNWSKTRCGSDSPVRRSA